MAKPLTIAEQVAILFEHAAEIGLPTELRTIAAASDMTPNSVHKIRRGQVPNPGVLTMKRLAGYFGVRLAYFDCETEQECWDFIRRSERAASLDGVALRASKVTPEGLRAIEGMIEYVEKLERQMFSDDPNSA